MKVRRSFLWAAGVGLLVMAVVWLVGGDDYPRAWPALEGGPLTALQPERCPKLDGTYQLGDQTPAGGLGMHETFLAGEGRKFRSGRWNTLTIDGDAGTMLTLAFARFPDDPSTTGDEQSPGGVRFIRAGQAYRCAHGQLEAAITAGDPRRSDADRTLGTLHVARDRSGALVAHSEVRQARRFDLWCGDGCRGIPLGTWTVHRWGRWPSTSAPDPATAERVRPLIPSGMVVVQAAPRPRGIDVTVMGDASAYVELERNLKGSPDFLPPSSIRRATLGGGRSKVTFELVRRP